MNNKNTPTIPIILQRAREMRRKPTETERRLWRRLRRKQVGGYKFRRQHVNGRFIVDFYCHEARLILEIDGETHAFQEEYDAARTAWLEEQGNRVVRFSNQQIYRHMDEVMQYIFELCEPSPQSPPEGRGGLPPRNQPPPPSGED